jgi:hypothetical protein
VVFLSSNRQHSCQHRVVCHSMVAYIPWAVAVASNAQAEPAGSWAAVGNTGCVSFAPRQLDGLKPAQKCKARCKIRFCEISKSMDSSGPVGRGASAVTGGVHANVIMVYAVLRLRRCLASSRCSCCLQWALPASSCSTTHSRCALESTPTAVAAARSYTHAHTSLRARSQQAPAAAAVQHSRLHACLHTHGTCQPRPACTDYGSCGVLTLPSLLFAPLLFAAALCA